MSDAGEFELTVELQDQSSMLIEDGYAFVLVSAEPRGVCNPTPDRCPSTSLSGADPGRYGTLRHPGDAYSFDIFNHALQAIRFPSRVAPLGGLETRYLIAEGFQRSIDKYFPHGTPDPQRPTCRSASMVRSTPTLPAVRMTTPAWPTPQSYVEALRAATDDAVEDGFLLCEDADTILRQASESGIGGRDRFAAVPACD